MKVLRVLPLKNYDEDTDDKHLKLIQDDASSIGEWFGPREVDVIHLNFSDPWPKKALCEKTFIKFFLFRSI